MAATRHIILAVHITNRIRKAAQVQKVLSAYGCSIRTRLGLHETGPDACSPNGLLILELVPDVKQAAGLVRELKRVQGIKVRKIEFPG